MQCSTTFQLLPKRNKGEMKVLKIDSCHQQENQDPSLFLCHKTTFYFVVRTVRYKLSPCTHHKCTCFRFFDTVETLRQQIFWNRKLPFALLLNF